LALWNGKRTRNLLCFAHGGVCYQPVRLEKNLARAMRLPAGGADFGSTRALYDELFGEVKRVDGLSDGAVAGIVRFVFATWLVDRLPMAPCLWLIAPPTVPRDHLLRLLGVLCRRTIFINELTIDTLRSLPTELRPTLVTEAVPVSRSLLKALRISSRQGSFHAAGGRLEDLFCGKIVCADRPLGEASLPEIALEIALVPTRTQAPSIDATEFEGIAAKFQGKLLGYRLANFQRVTTAAIDLSELTPPMRDLAQILAMCVVGDADLQRETVGLIKARDREMRVDRTLLLESIMLEALLAETNKSQASVLSVQDLTADVNTILAGRGDERRVSPEIIGWKLRAVGFFTESITGGRKGLRVTEKVRARIQELAASYGVRMLYGTPVNTQAGEGPER
jgi:hypothetical protein